MNTGALALSSLLVLASALVIPAWRNKRHAGARAETVRVLSILTLAAAVAATIWIVLQVLSVGVHHTSRARGGSWPGSVFGVPVIVIPLAILVALVGVVEALIRTDERSPIPTASGTGPVVAAAAAVSPPVASSVPHAQVRVGGLRRHLKVNEALEHIHNEFPTGEVYSETVTADAIAQIESRWTRLLEQQAHVQASTRDAVEELHSSVGSATTDTDAALQRVTEMCTLVTDGLDALRRERRVLVEAIALLARPAPRKSAAQRAPLPTAEISIVDDEPDRVLTPIVSPVAQPVLSRMPSRDDTQPSRPRSRVRTSAIKRFQQRVQQAGQRVWTRVGPASDPALTTLRIRFARGEIDSTEYAARAAQLAPAAETASPPPSGASA